jgi:uncharacterized protein YgbK (DUF1537 family)
METKSTKTEILSGLAELKEKGVRVIVHDSFIERQVANTYAVNSGAFVTFGTSVHHNDQNDVIVNIKTMKKATDLTVNIYQNSSEDEIKSQITSINNHLKRLEEEGKSTAIVDFLKEELK